MFVMRMSDLQGFIARMGLRVIPVQLPLFAPNFISIRVNHGGQPIEQDALYDYQADSMVKSDLAGGAS
jgi:hypothetical protein